MSKTRKVVLRDSEVKNDLEDVVMDVWALFTSIFDIRLVEKLSRPIDNQKRNKILQEYRMKFSDLHVKLDTIKRQASQNYQGAVNSSLKTDEKSTRALKPMDYKMEVRKIQSKYTELFKEGSFQHYSKVAKLYSLTDSFNLLDIEEWKNSCLKITKTESRCC